MLIARVPAVLFAFPPGHAGPVMVAGAEHVGFFTCNLHSPGAARRFVVQVLRDWDRPDLVEDAAIVTAELTTNAVVHARSEFVVAIARVDGRVRLSVRDASVDLPVLGEPAVDAVSGRGLQLVRRLARRWDVELLGAGKVVWAELA